MKNLFRVLFGRKDRRRVSYKMKVILPILDTGLAQLKAVPFCSDHFDENLDMVKQVNDWVDDVHVRGGYKIIESKKHLLN